MRGDRGLGVAPARGEAVGDREDRDVGRVGVGRGQVAPDPAPRQRALVDEEAEPQVVERERGDVVGDALGGAQAAHDVAGELGALGVVADERHAAVGAEVARGGLGRVVEQRGEAHRVAAGEVVAERLGQQRAHGAGVLAERLRVRLQRGHRLEHLERVAVDVAVVEDVLLDAAQRRQLGQHDRVDPEVLGQPQPVGGTLGADDALELGEHALGRDPGQPGRLPAHLLARLRVELEPQLDGQARRPQRAQRVVGERGRRDHPQPPRLEVGPPAVGVERARRPPAARPSR